MKDQFSLLLKLREVLNVAIRLTEGVCEVARILGNAQLGPVRAKKLFQDDFDSRTLQILSRSCKLWTMQKVSACSLCYLSEYKFQLRG